MIEQKRTTHIYHATNGSLYLIERINGVTYACHTSLKNVHGYDDNNEPVLDPLTVWNFEYVH